MIHPSFLIAPGFASAFFALCVAKNAGPGAFFLSLVLLVTLAIGQPLIQIGLMHFRERPTRPWVAWAISFVVTFVPIVVAVALGAFSFW